MRLLPGALLIVITMLSSCYLGWPCEEPEQGGLFSMTFMVVDDGNIVFDDRQSRASLTVTNAKMGEPTYFYFTTSIFDRDTTYSGSFGLYDDNYDYAARDSVVCPTYILKYRTDDVDTLRICYKIKYGKKCGSTSLASTQVFWNNKLVSTDLIPFELELPTN